MENFLTDEQVDEVINDDWMWKTLEKTIYKIRSMSDHEVRRELELLAASMIGRLASWRRASGKSITVDPMPTQIYQALFHA